MSEKSIGSQGGSGFPLARKVFAIMGWLGLVIAGLAEAVGFASGGANRPVLRAAILVVAGVIFIWTMRHWAKIFPGVCAFGAFWAMMAVFTGHALGPDTPMTHTQAGIGVLAYGGAAFFTGGFKSKDFALRLPDRVGTLAFVFCIFWTAVDPRTTNLALGIGFFALFAAWLLDRLQRRRGRVRHNASGTADAV